MKHFPLCDACRAEYDNPADRRFHAQPNACPRCGPHLELWDTAGKVQATHDDALRAAADALRRGDIVAAKGLGGFHLLVDARNQEAVLRLRQPQAPRGETVRPDVSGSGIGAAGLPGFRGGSAALALAGIAAGPATAQ